MQEHLRGIQLCSGPVSVCLQGTRLAGQPDGYLGCIFVPGVAFLPCNLSQPDHPCLIPPLVQNPLVGKLHNLSALLYFIVLIVYSLFLFPKTHMDMVTGEKCSWGARRRSAMWSIISAASHDDSIIDPDPGFIWDS
jgi:hypothetical protein